MPEEKKKMVDIDTSGSGAEVEVPEKQVQETEPEVEVKDEKVKEIKPDSVEPDDTPKEPDIKPDVQDSKPKEDEKLEDYSEGVKKRISKLTRKWREAERQKDAAVEYAQSVEQKRKSLETRYTQLDSTYIKDSEERIKSQLEATKAKLAAAIEGGDTAKQVEAQAELSSLTGDARNIASEKTRREHYTPRTPAYGGGLPDKVPQSLPQIDEKAEDWAAKNEWFGKDKAMTFTAFEHHKDLVEAEGMDPTSDTYYAEINKRMKVDFPHKFATTEKTTPPVRTVASVTRSVKPGRQTVKLTSSQVQIAKKLGVPLEEYAKQLMNTEGA